MKFSVKDLFVNVIKSTFFVSLVKFIEEILIENFIFCVVGLLSLVFILYPHLVSAVLTRVPKTVKICRKAILFRLIISS